MSIKKHRPSDSLCFVLPRVAFEDATPPLLGSQATSPAKGRSLAQLDPMSSNIPPNSALEGGGVYYGDTELLGKLTPDVPTAGSHKQASIIETLAIIIFDEVRIEGSD